jgi:hypothetical protein
MSAQQLSLLIVGGYGAFGGRLARLLAQENGLTLIIAGRSPEKAAAFCEGLGAGAVPCRFDRDGDVEAQLRARAPHLVADASGPFQAYGADPYRLVRACLALGIDYMDFADASEFVRGIRQFDAAARERGLFALSGASSVPVLTAAAARVLARGMSRIDAITAGIAPSPYADVGLSVVRAIASYAGRPVQLWRDGRNVLAHAWTESRRYTIAPPGRLPLGNRRFSLVDVPDLQLLPELWPGVASVWMGAAPVPKLLHRALNASAWLVRLRLLRSLAPWAPLMRRVSLIARWGERRSGMFVAVDGADSAGESVARSWHLLAEGDDGPMVPSMAAAALVRRCLAGCRPPPGARPALADVELADYEPLFARRAIYTGYRQRSASSLAAPLFRRVLGDAWEMLPAPLRAMHDVTGQLRSEGMGAVERGTGLLARLLCGLVGFPRSGRDLPVEVVMRMRRGGEIWRRRFAGRSFASAHGEGKGREEGLIVERFGPLAFGFALVIEDERLRLVLRRWRLLGVPLPLALAPAADAFEFAARGRFHFNVAISHRLTGPIIAYRGWLVPCRAEPDPS